MRNIKLSLAVLTFLAYSFAQINLLSDDITFRSTTTANHSSTHYGDLTLSGGTLGTSWGWLTCNHLYNNGFAVFNRDVSISGALQVYGTKNFIQLHPTDDNKAVRYICIESGEALTVARGTATTLSGIAEITLPEHFALVTSNLAPLTVLLTPEKVPVLLYTKDKTKEKVIVAMKKSDFDEFGDATFAWQITGVRDGFENQKVILDLDKNGNTIDDETVSPKRAKMNERIEKLMEKQKAAIQSKSK